MIQEEKNLSSWGAKATVYLKYDKNIYELAEILRQGLDLAGFSIETDQDPPHEYFGVCDALGFRVWLHHETSIENFDYVIEIKTSNAFEEIFHDKMHDISIWFAKYISLVCPIKTYVYDNQLARGFTFTNGKDF